MTVLTISTNHSATGLHYLKESLNICSQHGLHYKLKVLGKDGGKYTMWHSKFMEIINTLRYSCSWSMSLVCALQLLARIQFLGWMDINLGLHSWM